MSIFKKVFAWIGNLFNKASHELEDVVLPAAIAVTTALRAIINTDTPDIIGHLAGAAGANLEDKLRSILNEWVPKLQLAQAFRGQDPGTILANVLKIISTSDTFTQTAFWIEFSGMIAHAMEDGKIDPGEAATLVKYWYDQHS